MFSHVVVGSNNIEASKKFYDAIFTAAGGTAGTVDAKGRLGHDGSLRSRHRLPCRCNAVEGLFRAATAYRAAMPPAKTRGTAFATRRALLSFTYKRRQDG
jgi:hypothetical protein